MKAIVTIMLKPSILDPQGQAISMALSNMGYGDINDVRMGKVVEIDFEDGVSSEDVKKRASEMAEKLLANPVMETFKVDIV